jgi:Transglutaminase-like superfamily
MHSRLLASYGTYNSGDSGRESSSRPEYFLSAEAFCCEVEDGAIILELATGTYIGIHAECLPDLRIRVLNWPSSNGIARESQSEASEKLIFDLVSRGVLTTSPTTARRSVKLNARVSLPMGGPSAASQPGVRLRHIVHFVISLIRVAPRYRHNLASLLRWLPHTRQSFRQEEELRRAAKTAEVMAAFLRIRVWFYTAHRSCLLDSLVLTGFLLRQGIPCALIIGVSTKPFLAHAWVQLGELVLNDTAEHVQTFTPILTVDEFS